MILGPLYSIMLIATILSFRLFPSAPEIYPFCTCEISISRSKVTNRVNADQNLTRLVIVLRENTCVSGRLRIHGRRCNATARGTLNLYFPAFVNGMIEEVKC